MFFKPSYGLDFLNSRDVWAALNNLFYKELRKFTYYITIHAYTPQEIVNYINNEMSYSIFIETLNAFYTNFTVFCLGYRILRKNRQFILTNSPMEIL